METAAPEGQKLKVNCSTDSGTPAMTTGKGMNAPLTLAYSWHMFWTVPEIAQTTAELAGPKFVIKTQTVNHLRPLADY